MHSKWKRAALAAALGVVVLAAATGETSCGAEGPPGSSATGAPAFKPKETDLIISFDWEGPRRPVYAFYSVPTYVKAQDPQNCPAGVHSFSSTLSPGGIKCRWHKFTYGTAHATIWQTGAGTVGCRIATGGWIETEHDAVATRKVGEKVSCDYDNPKPGNA